MPDPGLGFGQQEGSSKASDCSGTLAGLATAEEKDVTIKRGQQLASEDMQAVGKMNSYRDEVVPLQEEAEEGEHMEDEVPQTSMRPEGFGGGEVASSQHMCSLANTEVDTLEAAVQTQADAVTESNEAAALKDSVQASWQVASEPSWKAELLDGDGTGNAITLKESGEANQNINHQLRLSNASLEVPEDMPPSGSGDSGEALVESLQTSSPDSRSKDQRQLEDAASRSVPVPSGDSVDSLASTTPDTSLEVENLPAADASKLDILGDNPHIGQVLAKSNLWTLEAVKAPGGSSPSPFQDSMDAEFETFWNAVCGDDVGSSDSCRGDQPTLSGTIAAGCPEIGEALAELAVRPPEDAEAPQDKLLNTSGDSREAALGSLEAGSPGHPGKECRQREDAALECDLGIAVNPAVLLAPETHGACLEDETSPAAGISTPGACSDHLRKGEAMVQSTSWPPEAVEVPWKQAAAAEGRKQTAAPAAPAPDTDRVERVCLHSILREMEAAEAAEERRWSAQPEVGHTSQSATSECPARIEAKGGAADAAGHSGAYYFPEDEEEESEATAPSAQRLDLSALCQLVAAAEPALQQVIGRKVVVLLGKTGTGKSTLIHAIAGKRLNRVRYQQKTLGADDASFEKDVFEASEPLEGFRIGHDQVSQTKCIAHYERACGHGGDAGDGGVVYLDSSGYEDTAGPAVDIATSVSLRKVAEVCKSLRFVVLISTVSFLENRGGAIRALVKLISSFVDDFKRHCYAFSFLFTHTDFLRETANREAADVKAKLRGLLADTERGTERKEEKVRSMLKWMQHCLKSGYPFVDVFHPERSTAEALLNSMEIFHHLGDGGHGPAGALGLDPGESPRDVVRCGMMPATESMLKLELDRLLQELGVQLQGEHVAGVRSTAQTLAGLKRHIANGFVLETCTKGRELLSAKGESLLGEVEELVESARDLERNFGAANAQRLLRRMAVLQAFSDLGLPDLVPSDAGESALAEIRACLAELLDQVQGELGANGHRGLARALRRLAKLQVWAGVHEEFGPTFREGVAALGAFVSKAVDDAAHASADGADLLVASLARLEYVRKHDTWLAKLGVARDGIDEACCVARERVQARIRDAADGAAAALRSAQEDGRGGEGTVQQESELRVFQERSASLEHLLGELRGDEVLCELEQNAFCARQGLADEARAELETRHEAVMSVIAEGALTLDLEVHVGAFEKVLHSLTDFQRTETSADALFERTMKVITTAVQQLQAQLALLCDQLKRAGVGAPEKHTEALKALSRCTWLDSHSARPDRTLASSMEGFQDLYRAHFSRAAGAVLRALREYLSGPTENARQLSTVRKRLPDVLCMPSFLPVCSRLEEVLQHYRSESEALISQWCLTQSQQLSPWPGSASELGALKAPRVNETLEACSSLAFLESRQAVHALRQLASEVGYQMQRLGKTAQELLSAPAQYAQKQALLDALAAWQSLRHVCSMLPSLLTCREAVQQEVRSLADQVQAAATEGADLEEAHGLLSRLKEAQAVDSHTNRLAGHCVHLLSHALEMRRTQIEEVHRKKIEACDFADMREHIEILASSGDTVKKQRFRELVDAIASSVSSKINAATAQVASGGDIVEAIGILERAGDEVGELLQQQKCLDITDAVVKLRARANAHCQHLVEEFESAVKIFDCRSMFMWYRSTVSYLESAGSLVGADLHDRAADVTLQAHGKLQTLDSLIDDFISNSQKPSKDRVDTSKLVDMLQQLRLLAESVQTGTGGDEAGAQQELFGSAAATGTAKPCRLSENDCAQLYGRLTLSLSDGLLALHHEICSRVADNHLHTMAVEIYSHLKHEWDNGLRDHVQGLQFDIAQELEAAQDRQQRSIAEHKRLLNSPSSVDEYWIPVLSRLQNEERKSWLPWLFPWGQREYGEKCDQLCSCVLEAFSCTVRCLEEQDYETAGSHASVLRRMCTELREHMPDPRAAGSAEELTGHLERCLCALCDDLIGSLNRGLIHDFETLFTRLHKFMQHIAPDYPDLAPAYRTLHQRICEHVEASVQGLDGNLQSLDFFAASEAVQALRKLGRFLTGAFTLYRQDVRHFADDPSLARISELSSQHFGGKLLASIGQHYALLQVAPTASWKEIHKAYVRKSREHHPDMHARRGICRANPHAMQQRVEQAKDALSDEHKREEYARGLAELFSPAVKTVPGIVRGCVERALGDADYKRASTLLTSLGHLHVMRDLASPPLDGAALHKEICAVVREHVNKISGSVFSNWDRRKLKDMHDNLAELAQIEKYLSGHADIYSPSSNREIHKKVEHEIQTLSEKATSLLRGTEAAAEENMRNFALQLIFLGHILDDLPQFKDYAKMVVNNVLEACQSMPSGFAYLFKLGTVLERGTVGLLDETGSVSPEDQRIGKVIVNEFKHFKDVVTLVWNEQTAITQKDISDTLKEVSAMQMVSGQPPVQLPVDTETLRQGFQTYKAEYDKRFHEWRAGLLQLDQLARETVALAAGLHPCRIAEWTPAVKKAVPILLGGIFAYFTISKSGESYSRLLTAGESVSSPVVPSTQEGQGVDADSAGPAANQDEVLLKPHNIQVVTILRMLGYDSSAAKLDNHVMQVRTGEGKSIILGACAVLLGLLGFSVRTVCYSEYLSERDHKLFSELFAAFGVADRIAYMKIRALGDARTTAKGDLRVLTRDLLRNQDLAASAGRPPALQGLLTEQDASMYELPAQSAYRNAGASWQALPQLAPEAEQILLVDEVDVFFGPDFYGETYNPVVFLEEPEVFSIIRAIWGLRAHQHQPGYILERITALGEYQALSARFPDWGFLLKREVAAMCNDVRDFNNPPYHYNRSKNRVGYRHMDGMDYDFWHGYKTAFAYLYEDSRGTLRDADEALRHGLKLKVSCGSFSYANINPACILGVSGTIEALGDYEWRVMNRYAIQTYSLMPSVYGHNKLRFLDQEGGNPITLVSSKEDWFLAITEEVSQTIRKGRAAVTFFEQASELEEYTASPYYRKIANKSELRESQDHQDKEYAIKKAATAGQATFTTAVFGRGTDFFCNDPGLHEAGGVHIIQAFFSLEKSEEVQIQGRTARQGKKGTYSMILLQGSLTSKLGVGQAEMQQKRSAELYATLEEARKKCHRTSCDAVEKKLRVAEELDALSHAYFDALLSSDRKLAIRRFQVLYDRFRPRA